MMSYDLSRKNNLVLIWNAQALKHRTNEINAHSKRDTEKQTKKNFKKGNEKDDEQRDKKRQRQVTKQNIDKQNKVNDTNRPDAFFPFA